jgi:Glucose dehydrogenase C-terminus
MRPTFWKSAALLRVVLVSWPPAAATLGDEGGRDAELAGPTGRSRRGTAATCTGSRSRSRPPIMLKPSCRTALEKRRHDFGRIYSSAFTGPMTVELRCLRQDAGDGIVRRCPATLRPTSIDLEISRPNVVDPGPTGGLKKGDLVVGIVCRPDPVPCPNCAVGEWDMCRNGQYTERGIKQIDGFMSERWRIEPEYAMKVDSSLGLLGVLLEPTTVVTKAWEQIVVVGQRAFWDPRTVLITGAGPIGLLAALLGKQRGLDVHVLDRVDSGPKPNSSAPSVPAITLVPWQASDSSRTSSSNARASGR